MGVEPVGDRPINHGRDLIVVDRARPARARLVGQHVDTTLDKAPTPLPIVLVNTKRDGHDLALKTLGTAQNDPATY